MIRLSIIVPVYNGARVLPGLIETLTTQDLSQEEYEILFVDDCSTDNSIDIIYNYACFFPNIRLIRHSENSRLATTCNTGLDNARGRLVWLVDQDDWIEQNCINYLIEESERNSLDVLLFNYIRVNDERHVLETPKVFCDSEILSGRSFVNKYFYDSFDCYLMGYRWRALFSLGFLKNCKLHFIDGMMYDDTTFLLKAILYSSRVESLEKAFYYYRLNSTSITYSKQKKGDMIYESSYLVGREVDYFANEYAVIDNHYSNVLRKRATLLYNSCIIDLLRTTAKERHRYYHHLRQERVSLERMSIAGKFFLTPVIGPLLADIASIFYHLKHRF